MNSNPTEDNIDKSLRLLKQYLAETSINDREKLWAEVKALGIEGPTVEEYLKSIKFDD